MPEVQSRAHCSAPGAQLNRYTTKGLGLTGLGFRVQGNDWGLAFRVGALGS